MIRKYFLPGLAVFGVIFALFVVVKGNKPMPAAGAAAEPPTAPFRSYVAGTGMVEAGTENIAIASEVPGVVTNVFVKVGDQVKAGAPLFKLDERNLRATLAIQHATLRQAQEKLAKLKEMPRPEELPPAEALVREAQGNFDDARNQYELAQSLGDSRAMSREELVRRQHMLTVAESKLKNAQANFQLLKAGAWKPDVDIAQADVAYAQSQVNATQTDIDRLTVKAPLDGQVLQVNVRIGEFAPTGILSTPLILFGDVNALRIRVDVDENEAWRVREGASAVAYVRGNRDLKTPLQFTRIEPYIVPKKSLTGQSTERVDTRVLQVIYRFERGRLPVYVGQQMDVYIEATDHAGAASTSATK